MFNTYTFFLSPYISVCIALIAFYQIFFIHVYLQHCLQILDCRSKILFTTIVAKSLGSFIFLLFFISIFIFIFSKTEFVAKCWISIQKYYVENKVSKRGKLFTWWIFFFFFFFNSSYPKLKFYSSRENFHITLIWGFAVILKWIFMVKNPIHALCVRFILFVL